MASISFVFKKTLLWHEFTSDTYWDPDLLGGGDWFWDGSKWDKTGSAACWLTSKVGTGLRDVNTDRVRINLITNTGFSYDADFRVSVWKDGGEVFVYDDVEEVNGGTDVVILNFTDVGEYDYIYRIYFDVVTYGFDITKIEFYY